MTLQPSIQTPCPSSTQETTMTFTITPDTAVASVAQHVVDNHSRQQSAELLADMYNKTMQYLMSALAIHDETEIVKQAENLGNIKIIAKAHNIHRDMMYAVLATMPYRG